MFTRANPRLKLKKSRQPFDPRAQQNACRHRENGKWKMGSVLTFDTKNSLYGRIRLETCVHDPISKRWAIHFKLIVV